MSAQVSGSGLTIAAVGARARALFEGHEVADSAEALWLTDPGGSRVCYFPARDVQMSVLRRNDHVTTSPWGGVTTWYTIMREARIVDDVAWSHDDGAAVAGHIAFAPRHVKFEIDEPAPPRHVPAHDPPYI